MLDLSAGGEVFGTARRVVAGLRGLAGVGTIARFRHSDVHKPKVKINDENLKITNPYQASVELPKFRRLTA